jgi:hypothetical protein
MGAQVTLSAALTSTLYQRKNMVFLRETGYGNRRKAVFTFNNFSTPLVMTGGVGAAVVPQLLDFPDGAFVFQGGVIDLTMSRLTGVAAGLSDTWTGLVALGSTVGIPAALTTTEQDLVQFVASAAAVGSLGILQARSKQFLAATPEGAPCLYDNTAGTKKAFLNILVDLASGDSAANPITVQINGKVTMLYDVLSHT